MTTWRARVLSPVTEDELLWLEDALVRLEDGLIVELGPYDGRAVDEDLRPGVLLPGFVDAHLHYPQTRIVGSATGPLLDWLTASTFPEEQRFEDEDHAAQVAAMFCNRLASSGTTLCLAYGSVHPGAAQVLLSALAEHGLKALAGPVLMDTDCPSALQLPAERAIPALEALIARWHGHDDGRLRVAVIPRFALSCSTELLEAAGACAHRHGLYVSTHLAETVEECRIARRRFGTDDYLQVYEVAGLIHDRCVLAHCIHLSDSEWDRLAAAGVSLAHCPDSNDFLGSGSMPVAAARRRGLSIAVGSDVAAGRSFRIPRILSSAYDNGLRQGVTLSAASLLWWGTRGGALALGHPETGQIRPGLEADLCLFDPPPWVEDADGVVASLIFDHDAPRMRQTWVRGICVWEQL
ncbi:MAG TPA: guanine deaminase [Deltaproteobacteria bacterium]|nr:guanine deaminase [Deltaproteobacteria bacterium]